MLGLECAKWSGAGGTTERRHRKSQGREQLKGQEQWPGMYRPTGGEALSTEGEGISTGGGALSTGGRGVSTGGVALSTEGEGYQPEERLYRPEGGGINRRRGFI
ncbi:hypothetical protein, partial [Virgibacillus alimentarius]|uniref:hypothetical protein n=1 Tax=Virgibacillus alimentarius TaxID=698769 RepID=UPI0018DB0A7C